MGLFKKFKEVLPAIGGTVGFAIAGPVGAAVGSGIGSLAGGKSVNDALVNAAIGGISGFAAQGMGFGKGVGTGSGRFLPSYTSQGVTKGAFGLGPVTSIPKGPSGMMSVDALAKTAQGAGSTGLGSLLDSNALKFGALGAGALALSGGLTPEEEEATTSSLFDDSYQGQARGKVIGPTSKKTYDIADPADMAEYNEEILDLQRRTKTFAHGGEHIGGGEVEGPGTGTSDSVPARLSDGEFVLTAKSVRGAGGGDRDIGAARLYDMMSELEATA